MAQRLDQVATLAEEHQPASVRNIYYRAVVAGIVLPSRREVDRLTGELTALKTEHESYKGHVTTHFQKTSELVANMTASYKAVYDHLATGAQSLCSETDALEAPKFGSPKLIFDPTIELATKPAAAAEEAPTETAPTTPSEPVAESVTESPAATSTETSGNESPATESKPESGSEWRLGASDSPAEERPSDLDSEPAPESPK